MTFYNVSARSRIRANVTRIHGNRGNFSLFEESERNAQKLKIETASSQLQIYNEKIAIEKFSGDEVDKTALEEELKSCEEYSDKICECLSLLVAPPRTNSVEMRSIAQSLLKSPTAPLPTFSSTPGENFELFLDQFEETISKFNYTQYDKLLLLKQQISGRALFLIDSLESNRQTYTDAKALLQKGLASVPVQKSNIIKQMSELKLDEKDEPFKYISDMRKIMHAVDNLKIDINDVMQFFFLNGMNETFRNQLKVITKNVRPSLTEIVDNFFTATEFYELALEESGGSQKSKFKKTEQSTCMVVSNVKSVQNPFLNCSLCLGANHPINRCTEYLKPKDKIERLKSISGCVRCGNSDHSVAECKFRFRKKCNICEKWHFTFLCPEAEDLEKKSDTRSKRKPDSSKTPAPKGENSKQLNIHSVTACLHHESRNLDTVLSTLTLGLPNKSKSVRALMDFGSQSSFIAEDLLRDQEYLVLDENVKVDLKGINDTKSYISKLIQMPLRFGEQVIQVKLLTLPSIDIALELPKLSRIVSQFKSKHYVLADSFLSGECDKIDGIGILLGANASSCFEGSYVKFGKDSVYMQTKFGVMLVGQMDSLLEDLSQLPVLTISNAINIVHSNTSPVIDENFSSNKDQYEISANGLAQNIDKFGPEELDKSCSFVLNEEIDLNVTLDDLDLKLLDYLKNNTTRNQNGRLVIPLLWNPNVKHLLAKNFYLAKSILNSNLRKLDKNKDKLKLVDVSFKELESLGVIERVPNFEEVISNDNSYSFLAHMPIFRPHKETTKVRVVYLSNLCDKGNSNVSHNQAMYAGPCINQKLSTSLLLLRFDAKLLCFDLKKAFLQIELPERDKNRLLFLWFKDLDNDDFSLEIFRNNRLPFGMKCSPTILMMGLHRILMTDSEPGELTELKKMIYSLIYMDNGAVSMNDSEKLVWAYEKLKEIFEPFKFELQQFSSNDETVKEFIDQKNDIVDLFGLKWDTVNDTIAINKVPLDEKANSKRLILGSIASVFDPHGFNGPVLNRARLFLHDIQKAKTLGWDVELGVDQLREWGNIVKQYNSSQMVSIPRCIGDRSDTYRLIAFSDASTQFYGCVLYLQSSTTKKCNFVLAKNKIVGKQLESKTVPSLELSAIVMGAEVLKDTKNEISGNQCVVPISIVDMSLYTDSLVSLGWLNSSVNKLDKMNKVSNFVKNRLERLSKICSDCPITFSFVDGETNPADFISRPVSAKRLAKSNFYTGPSFLSEQNPKSSRPDILNVTIPNPRFETTVHTILNTQEGSIMNTDEDIVVDSNGGSEEPDISSVDSTIPLPSNTSLNAVEDIVVDSDEQSENPDGSSLDPTIPLPSTGDSAGGGSVASTNDTIGHLISPDRFSSFKKLLRSNMFVFRFIDNLKRKLISSDPDKYSHLKLSDNIQERSLNFIIENEQRIHFREVFDYFRSPDVPVKCIPNLVLQLNLYVDISGTLRVGSKMMKQSIAYCPVLLPKKSPITDLVIADVHVRCSHSGIYQVLGELRKFYWVPCCFSVVKRVLNSCLLCRRFNGRSIKLNQSMYRDFRLDPGEIPFANVFLDYAGPFNVYINAKCCKVYVLVITCLLTRAINLKVSVDLGVKEFVRSLQLHCFEFGVPRRVISDQGSQIVAGGNIITKFLANEDVEGYLQGQGSNIVAFEQFYKGRKELGGLVECCVKLSKRLLSGSIRNNVLPFREFEYFVSQTVHLVNRRPIAFKESLRDTKTVELPDPITPELLLHGFHLPSYNLVPSVQNVEDPDLLRDELYDPVGKVKETEEKLRRVRTRLFDLYHTEFLPQLVSQAIDSKTRYKPVSHNRLRVGDLVLVKEENTKRTNLPLGRVIEVQINNLDEVTGAVVLKGSTGEKVKRHASALIPLLTEIGDESVSKSTQKGRSDSLGQTEIVGLKRGKRAAALTSEQRTRAMLVE